MDKRVKRTVVCAAITLAITSGAFAQSADPSYKADPDVYKIIYEDANLRVIESIRKAGVTDKLHSHPAASVVYALTDCKTKQTTEGKSAETDTKAGAIRSLPPIPAHTAENTGPNDCKQLFIERK
jgi:hypothetical protein